MSTKITQQGVEKLIEQELALANEEHPLFHSPHEGHNVIKEEVEETKEAYKEAARCLQDAWRMIRRDRDPAERMRHTELYAIATACEAIQVAAMCRKYAASAKAWEAAQNGTEKA